jgi:hypothetical protein
MYMCIMVSLWMTATSMLILGPVPNSTLSNLDFFTQQSMACVLWVGSTMTIAGFLRGTRIWKRHADIRDSYELAKWSIVAIGVSMGVYVTAVFLNYGNFLLSALGGSIGLGILIGSLWNAWDFANEIDSLNARLGKTLE